VLHVGAIQKRKNIARLVHAFERLAPDWHLVLAGSMGFGASEICAAIDASPARARIQVLGYVSEPGLTSLYDRCAIFAFPSLDEGFGMPVLEAMAHNLPVLTSNRSGHAEVAGDAALLVGPEDTDAISEGLKKLAVDVDLRKKLAARGRSRAAGFTWKAAVSKTWAVYSELLSRT
jgi:glycosyltransferase involved in cell wall biosynthesis